MDDSSSHFDAWIRPGSGRTVVHLTGELDLAAGGEIQAALDCAADLGARYIVVDLSTATFIDAHEIGLIVRAWRSAIERGVDFVVSGVQGQVADVFALLELGDLLADAGDPEGDVDDCR